MQRLRTVLVGAGMLLCATAARAESDLRPSGKLLLTEGVSDIEGAAGGGISTWAVITGYETRDGIGANVHATGIQLKDYQFRSWGAAVGFYDRLELSYAHQAFDTQGTGLKLGLGRNFTFGQDVYGAKVKLLGDAVYTQDSWVPQVAVGAQVKRADQGAVIGLLGGKDDTGVDWYVAATKVYLDESLVLSGAVRATKANQTGLLGFGGPNNDDYHAEFEGSAALLLTKRFAVGAEYRTKPNNLGLKEDDWATVFAAFAINKTLSITAAYVDLGEIATFKHQNGAYLSLQAGF
ncbi:DUF3034 family protein [Phenylobacterium sp.]|jgi:hypothetical protein|uniref:DUF3034 family protein n=1 Tax=Phenylobacterium sp. TaxID=1871053 RepID=UPI002F40CDD2